jgi:hypothetical protein
MEHKINVFIGGQAMKTYAFRVVVEPDEDRWFAYCPTLKKYGATTWGYTKAEAMIEDDAQWTEDDLKRLRLLK